MAVFSSIAAGEPAPDAVMVSDSGVSYSIDRTAGQFLVLAFLQGADSTAGRAMRAAIDRRVDRFDDEFATCFAIMTEHGDIAAQRLATRLPGLRVFLDPDGSIGRRFGTMPNPTSGVGKRVVVVGAGPAAEAGAARGPEPRTHCPAGRHLFILIDPDLRIREVVPVLPDGTGVAAFEAAFDSLPAPGLHRGQPVHPPILILPRVFEADLCSRLITLYEDRGGQLSGFMREVDGRTVPANDPRHKIRRDVIVEDEGLAAAIRERIVRRIVPEIAKAHMFHVTRMERYVVACYDAADGGHFGAHRDNTTSGTAHRRFAVSVNLNDGFEGGEICFPEYGPQTYHPPTGGAVVFSCALLHKVTPVTLRRRYAFLPFLYDDDAARLRAANQHSIAT